MPETMFRQLETQGSDLEQEYHLRNTILRIPLGLVFHLTPAQIADETRDFHYGLFHGSELIACVIASPLASDHFKIRQMAVVEPLQGHGIGKQLLTRVETELRSHGAKQISLHARDIATGFYSKLGYEPVGDWFTEVGIPHRKMHKCL